MQKHYILIDYENVHVKSLDLLRGPQFYVRVFLGPKNTRLPTDLVLAMKSLGDHADYVVLDAGGHNALDFHITYYLGKLTAIEQASHFHIISKDTGFDALIEHINKTGIKCSRSVSIEALPCVVVPLSVTVAIAAEANVPPTVKPATKKNAAELAALVLANLAKRKTALPRSEKTLRSTVRTLCGAQCSEKEIDAVFNRLVKDKHVVVDGGRVSYGLLGGD